MDFAFWWERVLTLQLKREEVVCSLPHGISECCNDASRNLDCVRPEIDWDERVRRESQFNKGEGTKKAYGDDDSSNNAGLIPAMNVPGCQSVYQKDEPWNGKADAEGIKAAEDIESRFVAVMGVCCWAFEGPQKEQRECLEGALNNEGEPEDLQN